MKKTLKIVLLAVAAVALLTGCDSMLESLFPEQTGQTTGASNTVTFNVTGYDNGSTGGIWAYQGPSATTNVGTAYAAQPIYVRLYSADTGTLVAEQYNWFSDTGYYTGTRSTSVTFNNVPDGSYYFEAWYDYDGDGQPTQEYNIYYYADTYAYYTYWNSSTWETQFFVSGGATSTESVTLYESYYSY